MSDPIAAAIDAIDTINAEDPTPLLVRGATRPKALGEAELATEWVRQLDPAPSAALLLAARAHHLRRWEVPRSTYPTGRAGYLRWKNTLHRKHADDVATVLRQAGCGDDVVVRVQDLVRKRGLGSNPDAQTFEDALCLVFLETQFDALAAKTDEETMVGVLVKSLAKMSPAGIAAAGQISFSDRESALLGKALETPS